MQFSRETFLHPNTGSSSVPYIDIQDGDSSVKISGGSVTIDGTKTDGVYDPKSSILLRGDSYIDAKNGKTIYELKNGNGTSATRLDTLVSTGTGVCMSFFG
jgi:hypothetical protein